MSPHATSQSETAVSQSSNQAHQGQVQRTTQEQEHNVGAKAQAGLNLNLFAAISGLFSGKKTKTADAKGNSTEHMSGKGYADGAGAASLGLNGAGEVVDSKKRRITEEQGQIQGQSQKEVEGSGKGINHLELKN